ncbi:MAG: T9SS type A sorting domain-containing protein, partial [Rhodothermales bacterium]|nr:T9SS type A sorting domain-containing protein [Rhodothermales bacterium]
AQLAPTPGAENAPPPPAVAEIFEIQGDGVASPFEGAVVTTQDNVVTALAPDGFFIQTPAARTDGDPNTSDGIFVFTGGPPAVSVGDQVDVTGEVIEFFGFTEFGIGATVSIDGPGPGLPPPVMFDATTPSPDPTAPSCAVSGTSDVETSNFECFEGMRVTMSGTVGESNQAFGSDPIAEVFVRAGSRAFREEGVEFPPPFALPPAIPIWDGNPEVFELDPDKLGLPNLIIPAGSTFDAAGVVGFDFGDYELWPASLTVDPAVLPAPVPAPAPGEGTVASLNLFRLFDDVDDPPSQDAQGNTRDDVVVPTAEYQVRLEKFSRYIRDVLRSPDVLAVQEAEKLGVLEDLAARIAADAPGVVYEAFLVEGNDIGTIDVGYLVRTDRVTVDAVTQLGKTETFFDPTDGSVDLIFDRPPLLLEGQFVGGRAIAVLNLHLRSLSGIENSERVRRKRLEGAQSVAQKVQDFQTTTDTGLAVVGDFNAFEFTDGFVHVVGRIQGDFDDARDTEAGPDLVDPNLTNQVVNLPAEARYSFVFRGNAQVLDHALTTAALDAAVTGFAYGRGNADAARVLLDDPATPLRASDHDGLVLFLDVTPPEITVAEDPIVLWPPNHKYQSVFIEDIVTEVTGASLGDVYIVEVASDEPENGDGDGNTMNDIVVVDCQTVDLRAERQGGGNGRVYTITLAAEDEAGNVGTAQFPVWVPKSKKTDAVDDGPAYTVASGCTAPPPAARAADALSGPAALPQANVPEAYALAPNYPNPFNPRTTIEFALPEATPVRLAVYDVTGREVARLVDGSLDAGRHRVTFDATGLPSGIYFYRITAGVFAETHRMVLVK